MAVIYKGTSMQDRITAIIVEGQAGEAADRATREAQGECRGRCIEMRARGLYDGGQPVPRKRRPSCGAKTRAGGECKVKVEAGKLRCRFHGGLSTGAKTQEGRARIAEVQRRRWQALREARAKAKADVREARRQARITAML